MFGTTGLSFFLFYQKVSIIIETSLYYWLVWASVLLRWSLTLTSVAREASSVGVEASSVGILSWSLTGSSEWLLAHHGWEWLESSVCEGSEVHASHGVHVHHATLHSPSSLGV